MAYTRDKSSEARASLKGAEISKRQALARINEEATIQELSQA
jgi:hypothetical protein